MVERVPNDAYRAAGLDLARGVDPEVADDIGHPVPPHLLSDHKENEYEEPRYQLEDPELDAEWQARNAAEQAVAPAVGELTIAGAQQNAARHAAEHRRIRGEERRAANPDQ